MEQVIRLKRKTVFGRVLMYPDNKQAELFAALRGTTTLDPYDVYKVLELGYSVHLASECFTHDTLSEFKAFCQDNELYR